MYLFKFHGYVHLSKVTFSTNPSLYNSFPFLNGTPLNVYIFLDSVRKSCLFHLGFGLVIISCGTFKISIHYCGFKQLHDSSLLTFSFSYFFINILFFRSFPFRIKCNCVASYWQDCIHMPNVTVLRSLSLFGFTTVMSHVILTILDILDPYPSWLVKISRESMWMESCNGKCVLERGGGSPSPKQTIMESINNFCPGFQSSLFRQSY